MRISAVYFSFFFLTISSAYSQQGDPLYQKLRSQLIAKFKNEPPGNFGTIVPGVASAIKTEEKLIALTFDACGGPTGSAYDEELIAFLRKEKIPATLFISGLWADVHPDLVRQLFRDTLFEIENHGLTHRPCTTNGKSRYNIKGTKNTGEVIDEIELNARKLKEITGRRPVYYRPGTATTDEAGARIAASLGTTIVNFDVLSGDAMAGTPSDQIRNNVINKVHPGAIVVMHMNRPQWNGYEALKEIIPQLRAKGYSFVKLQHHTLLVKQ